MPGCCLRPAGFRSRSPADSESQGGQWEWQRPPPPRSIAIHCQPYTVSTIDGVGPCVCASLRSRLTPLCVVPPHLLQCMFTTVSSQPNHHRGWVVTMELKFRRKPIKPVGSVLSVYRKPDRSNLKFSKNYFFEIKIPNKLEYILNFFGQNRIQKIEVTHYTKFVDV
jgi:hypothetical protein